MHIRNSLIAASLLSITSTASASLVNTTDGIPLFAGQHDHVGWLDITRNAATGIVDVTYEMIENNCLEELHLYIGDSEPNSAPGRYPYKATGLSNSGTCTASYTFSIPESELNCGSADPYYLAAHAVTGKIESTTGGSTGTPTQVIDYANFNKFISDLSGPDGLVNITHTHAFAAAATKTSYFDTMVFDTDGGTLAGGPYMGNCVDVDNPIAGDGKTMYTARVHPTYILGTDAAGNQALVPDLSLGDPHGIDVDGLIDKPLNIPQLNWVINTSFAEKISPNGLGNYTWADVQRAVWTIVDDKVSGGGLGNVWDQGRVDEIVAAAMLDGQNYVPSCGDKMVLILEPNEGRTVAAQATLIPVDLPCTTVLVGGQLTGFETAWALPSTAIPFGKGKRGKRGWGGYFDACDYVKTQP